MSWVVGTLDGTGFPEGKGFNHIIIEEGVSSLKTYLSSQELVEYIQRSAAAAKVLDEGLL